ncbi:MAG: DNRLRE domain-containing protein [Syntrophomonadaceae bacterium]|nr:DNRLRE domain-containing protein [Syntrophomonadaceae bacterium]
MGKIVFNPCQFSSISEWNHSDILRRTDPTALYISRYQNPGDAFRSLLKFDLELLTLDQNYQAAYLKLFIYRNHIEKGTIEAAIHPIMAHWDQYSVNWNIQPPFSDAGHTVIIPAGWEGHVIFEISGLLQKWLDGTMQNHGLIIIGDEKHDNLVAFASGVYPERDKRPQLILISEASKQYYGLV